MKNMKNRKSIVLVLAAVMAVVIAVTGSTFAWFTATDAKKNHFETARITDGTVSLFEIFKSPTEWMPDQEVLKLVAASNTGENDVMVRISFEEYLNKLIGPVQTANRGVTNSEYPVLFNDSYYTAANGFDTVAAAGLTVDTALASTLTTAGVLNNLKVKVETAVDSNGVTRTGYAFVLWYDVPGGNTYASRLGTNPKQVVQGDFYVEDGVIYLNGNLKFMYFTGRSETTTAWAAFNAPQITTANGFAANAPINKPAAAATGYSQLDATNKYLELVYDSITATPTAGSWCYNPDDGYFYFIGVVKAGEISPYLLKGVKLNANAGSEYSDLDYDLYVNMEAIQPVKTALTSATGWNMGSSAASTAIIDALNPYYMAP